jgi:hypothetical protein
MLQRTKHIVSICDHIFNPKECQELARKHRFIQRSSSKLQGDEFVKTLILPSNNLAEDSLDGLCQRMREFNPEANLTASALVQRMNTCYAVSFMKACMQKVLKYARLNMIKQYTAVEGVLNHFNNIYIQDSTIFELNKHLHKSYPGTNRGGKSFKAQMKIDLIHNFSKGTIEEAEIYEGRKPDQTFAEKIMTIINPKDLTIRDLGYFKIETFKKISDIDAYFVSRFPSHVKVYLSHEDKEPINLINFLKKKHRNSSIIDVDVCIGEERLPVRLVAYKLSRKVSAERRRKANKKSKDMGRTMSESKKSLLDYSIFITNVPRGIFSAELIGTIYRLRWEIELIFKQWKSLLKIDVLKGIYQERIDCLIWGRLCMVILLSDVISNFMNLARGLTTGELSPTKLITYLMRNDRFCIAVKTNKLENFENEIRRDLRRLLKNKRKRSTLREKIIESQPYYGAIYVA